MNLPMLSKLRSRFFNKPSVLVPERHRRSRGEKSFSDSAPNSLGAARDHGTAVTPVNAVHRPSDNCADPALVNMIGSWGSQQVTILGFESRLSHYILGKICIGWIHP